MSAIPVTHCAEEDCGQAFTPTRSDARYCSSSCRQRAYRRRSALLASLGARSWDDAWPNLVAEHERLRGTFEVVTDGTTDTRNARGQ